MMELPELQKKINALEQQLVQSESTNKKLMEAAHKALITDRVENSNWLKENVKIPVSFLRPTLERRMKFDFDGDEFKVINVDANGERMLSYELAGIYPTSDEAIKRIVMEMPDYQSLLKESAGNQTDNKAGGTINRTDFDAKNPAEKHSFIMGGGTVF